MPGSNRSRAHPMSLAKRRELSVYRRVGLRWDAKSRAARRRIEQEGIFRFIGEGTSSRPWIKVLRTEYLRAWNRAAEVMNRSPLLQQLEDGRAANLLRQSLERLIYDDLVAHARDLAQMEQQFERTHGRAMSPHELECCLRTMGTQPVPAQTSTPAVRATQLRQVRLNQVMRNLRRQHGSHVNQLQDVWAASPAVRPPWKPSWSLSTASAASPTSAPKAPFPDTACAPSTACARPFPANWAAPSNGWSAGDDAPPSVRMKFLRLTAAVWGIVGACGILGKAILKILPHAIEAFQGPLKFYHWLFLVPWVFFMVYQEGFKGFQRKFSPRVVARARHLAGHATLLQGSWPRFSASAISTPPADA
ncbi:MAG: hypothetical protein HC901_04640 [Bdellovibrionaceae bacterium]|nr:hypothetical protein [Pseudobdellovibrionaceae bacterium]